MMIAAIWLGSSGAKIADAGDTVYRKMEFGEAIGERFNATEARRAGGISMIGIVEGQNCDVPDSRTAASIEATS